MISVIVGGMSAILTVREAYKLGKEMINNFTKMTWGEIIRRTTSSSLKELTEEKIEDIIFLLNDEENLKKMEEYFKKCSSYELEEVMKDYIYLATFTLKIDLKDNERKEFADLFFEIFCSYIKKENQEMYDKLIMNKKLNELLKDKIRYKTLKKEEDTLQDNTQFPFEKINLDFFDYEDEEFSKNLKEKIENNEKTIYIEGSSKEEAYYCVLSELKRMEKQDRKVYIITEREEWDKCDEEIKDAILIPYFYSNEIFPIKDNINIFIFGRYENCSKRNKIILKRRLIKNLQKKLEEFYVGNKSQYIYNLIKRTNGIFSNLKRIILNAYFEPKWLEKVNNFDFDIVEKALFLGEWTEKDKENVASLIEMDYDLFIKKIHSLIILEDPFLIKIETFNPKYKLANSEEAWGYLGDKVLSADWEKYRKKIINILSEIDDLYKEELKMDFLIEKDGQRKYSKELKNGLLKSLILYKNVRVSSVMVNFLEFDNAIESIFDNIINSKIIPINKWAYISEHILLMCEIAPSVVMEKLENELEENTGLLDIMKAGEDYNFFGSNYYVNFLWAIEYLLQYEETAIKAIDWLLSINDKNIKYSMSNSPQGTLKYVFNTWRNEVFLTTDEKIVLAEKAIKNYKKGWEIISNELPKNGDIIVGELAKPVYSKYIDDIPPIDTKKIVENYMRLCIENLDKDIEKVIKLLDFLQYIYYFRLLEKVIIILEKMVIEWDDEKREKLKFKLRNIIFKYRYYERQEIPSEVIDKINDLHDKITFDNSIWGFVFLFRGTQGSFPLLEPIPLSNKEHREENEKKVTAIVEQEFRKFKETEHDFIELLSIKAVENFYLFGKYIAEFYSANKYNEDVCKKVLNTKNEIIILAYVEKIFKVSGNEELIKIINLAFSLEEDKKLIIKIIAKQVLDKTSQKNYPIIDELSEDVQEIYWENNSINFSKNKETITYVIEKCIKYGNENVFEYLAEETRFILAEEYLDYLTKIMDKNNISIRNISLVEYYVEEIFNKIYEKFYRNNEDIEIYRKIAKVELYYRGILSWDKLKCFVYLLKKEPNYYAAMINIVYKHEEEKELTVEEQKSAKSLFGFYYDIKFCPCTHKTNNINEIELEEWVNEFEKLLEGQKQKKLLGMELGKLFAFSPQGNDGFYPHESVRKIIEKLKDQELKKSYIITILNKRGIYSPDAGITEKKLSEEYKKNAKGLKFYPFTASIYNEISKDYMLHSQNERRRAEHGV
ncbi:hypothetical protein [Fusobacterium ulcerans]|uniref:hypothetical protein n=1 Tax=Fusobacterium ulcerans TaxID=861 RepID=UPI00241BF375|nr:hypothetical protein [Fusobacterium ulcerans]